jgi:mannose-6-phosphate isomerase-like protein (cupin superfamily)
MHTLLTRTALAVILLAAGRIDGSAQGVIITADSIASARAASAAANTVDRLISGVPVPGGRFALAALRRVRAETNGLIHSDVTEVYYITSGSGTLVTGGRLSGIRGTNLANVWAGPSLSGTHESGDARPIGPGDVIVVPAGTAHRLSVLDGSAIEYLVFRFEGVD